MAVWISTHVHLFYFNRKMIIRCTSFLRTSCLLGTTHLVPTISGVFPSRWYSVEGLLILAKLMCEICDFVRLYRFISITLTLIGSWDFIFSNANRGLISGIFHEKPVILYPHIDYSTRTWKWRYPWYVRILLRRLTIKLPPYDVSIRISLSLCSYSRALLGEELREVVQRNCPDGGGVIPSGPPHKGDVRCKADGENREAI